MKTLYIRMTFEDEPIPVTLVSVRYDTEVVLQQVFDQLLRSSTFPFIAVDTEWKPNFGKLSQPEKRLDVLQFSTHSACVIVQVHSCHSLPSCIRNLLVSSKIIKVFKDSFEDLSRFSSYFNVDVEQHFDSSVVFRHLSLRSGCTDVNKRNPRQPGSFLKALGLTPIHSKDINTTKSDWAVEALSTTQLNYAAFDAWSIAITVAKLLDDTEGHIISGRWKFKTLFYDDYSSTNVRCTSSECSLVPGSFSSMFDMCQAISKSFSLMVLTVYDFCQYCQYSSGDLDDSLPQCCDSPWLIFKGVCKGCLATFLFPSELVHHVACVSPSPCRKFPPGICKCGERVNSSRFGDLVWHLINFRDRHESLYSKLVSSITDTDPIFEEIFALYHRHLDLLESDIPTTGVPRRSRSSGFAKKRFTN
ncbi:hypothetical protein P9112_002136 [Eukaryota sp. TZLM1-RC]